MTARYAVRYGSLGYLALILIAPMGLIFWRAFEHGLHPFWAAISNPAAAHALKLTLEIAVIAVPANTIFGVACSLAIVRHRIPGMGLVNAVVDLPMALSPVVVGLALYLLYARDGWFGGWLFGHGVHVLFALPAMLLATIFVSLPFVVREVVPARDRHRAGGGRGNAGLLRVHDISADHAARHPVGGRLRRRADDRALSRRVRRGEHRLRWDRGPYADTDAVRAGVV
jgi:ABC-type sulfate transport system permease subunit